MRLSRCQFFDQLPCEMKTIEPALASPQSQEGQIALRRRRENSAKSSFLVVRQPRLHHFQHQRLKTKYALIKHLVLVVPPQKSEIGKSFIIRRSFPCRTFHSCHTEDCTIIGKRKFQWLHPRLDFFVILRMWLSYALHSSDKFDFAIPSFFHSLSDSDLSRKRRISSDDSSFDVSC